MGGEAKRGDAVPLARVDGFVGVYRDALVGGPDEHVGGDGDGYVKVVGRHGRLLLLGDRIEGAGVGCKVSAAKAGGRFQALMRGKLEWSGTEDPANILRLRPPSPEATAGFASDDT